MTYHEPVQEGGGRSGAFKIAGSLLDIAGG